MDELMFRGVNEMGTWVYDRDIDIFSKKMLSIPYSFNEHIWPFVVVNASTQLNSHGVNSVSEEYQLLIHFDTSPTGSK